MKIDRDHVKLFVIAVAVLCFFTFVPLWAEGLLW